VLSLSPLAYRSTRPSHSLSFFSRFVGCFSFLFFFPPSIFVCAKNKHSKTVTDSRCTTVQGRSLSNSLMTTASRSQRSRRSRGRRRQAFSPLSAWEPPLLRRLLLGAEYPRALPWRMKRAADHQRALHRYNKQLASQSSSSTTAATATTKSAQAAVAAEKAAVCSTRPVSMLQRASLQRPRTHYRHSCPHNLNHRHSMDGRRHHRARQGRLRRRTSHTG